MDTGVVHPFYIFCATVPDHGKFAKRYTSSVAVASIESFMRVEDAYRKLRVYSIAYDCYKLPGLHREAIADYLDTVYDGDFDDVDWAMTNFKSTRGGFVARCAQKFCECSGRV